jgi:hypothetical protein
VHPLAAVVLLAPGLQQLGLQLVSCVALEVTALVLEPLALPPVVIVHLAPGLQQLGLQLVFLATQELIQVALEPLHRCALLVLLEHTLILVHPLVVIVLLAPGLQQLGRHLVSLVTQELTPLSLEPLHPCVRCVTPEHIPILVPPPVVVVILAPGLQLLERHLVFIAIQEPSPLSLAPLQRHV